MNFEVRIRSKKNPIKKIILILIASTWLMQSIQSQWEFGWDWWSKESGSTPAVIAWTPKSIADMVYWGIPGGIVLNGVNITQWTDSSGTGNHLTQDTTARNPNWNINGGWARFIQGSPMLLLNFPAGAFDTLTGAEMFVVMKVFNDGNQGGWYLGTHALSTFIPHTGSIYDGAFSDTRKSVGTPKKPFTTWWIYNVSSSDTGWTTYINDTVQFNTGTNTVANSPFPAFGKSIGDYGLNAYVKTIIIYGRALTQEQRDSIYNYLDSIYKPVITYAINDTVPYVNVFDTVGTGAYFSGIGEIFYQTGTESMTSSRQYELNFSTTDTISIDIWFRPTKTSRYALMSKNDEATYGWYIASHPDNYNQLMIHFIGTASRTICTILDTTINHHIVITYDKTDSTLRTYHGAEGTIDTLTNTYTGVYWNSDFHTAVDHAFVIGGYSQPNSDCSITPSDSTNLRYKGWIYRVTFEVDDTVIFFDMRQQFTNVLYDVGGFTVFDRPSYSTYHLWNGTSHSYSYNDALWWADDWTSPDTTYTTQLWDTNYFYKGIQYKTADDSTLCESFGLTLDTVDWNGKASIIWGGKGNVANGTGWDARNYDELSPNIFRWDSDSAEWEGIGQGFNGTSFTMAHHSGILFVGGGFTRTYSNFLTAALGDTVNYIAQFHIDTGTTWRPVFNNQVGLNNTVNAMCATNDTLYFAGAFTAISGEAVGYIAGYANGTMFELDAGVNDWVFSLEMYDGKLIAGGDFTGNIAQWDGVSWTNPFGAGITGRVIGLKTCRYNNTLWIGSASGLFIWNGQTLDDIGGTQFSGYGIASGDITDIEFYGHLAFLTGSVTHQGGRYMRNLCMVDIRTMTYYNIGTIDLRGEEFAIYTNPDNGLPYLIYNGDGYNMQNDNIRFGNVIGLDLSKLE